LKSVHLRISAVTQNGTVTVPWRETEKQGSEDQQKKKGLLSGGGLKWYLQLLSTRLSLSQSTNKKVEKVILICVLAQD
jgi:hypothetical protein